MIKQSVDKIYSCVIKLIQTIEENINEYDEENIHDAIKTNKNITDTLLKLVTLINNLKQLSKLDDGLEIEAMPAEDLAIIHSFLRKHRRQEHHDTKQKTT